MASIWRIDGIFWTCALKKRGQVFTRVGLLVKFILWSKPGPAEAFWKWGGRAPKARENSRGVRGHTPPDNFEI